MNKKDKELLLKDICARLPYNPIVVNKNIDGGYPCELSPYGSKTGIFLDSLKIEDTKIFLRPMSSMTEEEKVEYEKFFLSYSRSLHDFNVPSYIDWLNAHHFDYRGLIPMGLALEAPEEMYGKI